MKDLSDEVAKSSGYRVGAGTLLRECQLDAVDQDAWQDTQVRSHEAGRQWLEMVFWDGDVDVSLNVVRCTQRD